MTSEVTLNEQTLVRRAPNTAFRELEGKVFLLGAGATTFQMLNETGTAFWRYLEQDQTLGQLVDRLAEDFEVERDTALDDCQTFIDSLVRRELVLLEPQDHRAAPGGQQDRG
jgi:hypothetical protein